MIPLKPHRGGSVLAVGICSIVFAGACGTGIILGIVGLSMSKTDLTQIDRGQMDPSGRGMTQAGRICSIIGTCLGGISLVVGVLYILFVVLMIGAAAAGAAGKH